MKKLLLVDEDRTIASLLKSLLAFHGYEVSSVERPSMIRECLDARTELILMDVVLPELDGFEVCRTLRAAGERRPIIMLAAKGDDADRIRGLTLGADDYMSKPFNPLELVARIEAVLRRSTRTTRPTTMAKGLDPESRVLRHSGRAIALTPTEYRLMEAFTGRPGRTFTRGELLNLLDTDATLESYDRAIDLHISRLRTKLEEDLKQPRHLLTVRGLGYRFEW